MKIKTWTDPETGRMMAESKNGTKWRILCTDGPGDYSVVGVSITGEEVCSWTLSGLDYLDELDNPYNLVTESEPQDPLSCPFCGKEAEHHLMREDMVACYDISCPGGKSYVLIDDWNRRASTGPTWEQIDEVRKKIINSMEHLLPSHIMDSILHNLPTCPEDK